MKSGRMDVRNGFLALTFLALIASDVSDGFLVPKLRKLVGEAPKPNSTAKIPPVPSPVSGGKKSNLNPNNSTGAGKPDNKKPVGGGNDPLVPNNSSKLEPKSSSDVGTMSPPVGEQTSTGREKGDTDNSTSSQAGIGANCDQSPYKCMDQNKMVACLQSLGSGSREFVLLVQNEGESTLKVNLVVPTSARSAFKNVEIHTHQTKRMKDAMTFAESSKIVLDAGHGNCTIRVDLPASKVNYLLRLPTYSQLVTPINGAYLMLFTALIFGGTWACCKFRKRRRRGGVPYQELEMGLPESVSATNVETSEGWDEGWDDDWDEGTAVNTPGGHVGSISANGLTLRSSNKDGWENDWDD